jgi:hypothetical protein
LTQNNATCTDKINGFSCSCPSGYTGSKCDINIGECKNSPCLNGTCVDRINGYSCSLEPVNPTRQ